MAIRRGTYDATEFDARPDDVADALIVGSGPSGAVYAQYLASWGFHVVCLEQGEWMATAEYPGSRAEYELSRRGVWHPSGNVRKMPADYPVNTDEAEVDVVMYPGVGGASIHYAGQFARLTPADFRVRTLDGLGDDWPLTYEDLVPYYEQVDIDFAVSGMPGDPAYPDGAPPPSPAMPIGLSGRKLAEGFNKMGMSWWPAPNSIAQKNTGDLVPCVRYGTCETGCPNGSKASVDVSHWPSALKNGATLVTGATVSKITTDEDGRATGATFVDRNGQERHIRAEVVVLAANGVGTPRLLLNSTSPQHPSGLANSSDMVGRNLMLHPPGIAMGVVEDDLQSWMGPAGQNIHSYEYYETDKSRGFSRGAKWLSMPAGGPLAAAELVADLGGAQRGGEFLTKVQKALGRTLAIVILGEDLPNPENRVTLDPKLVDRHGIPAPRVVYTRDQNNIDMIKWHLAKAREVLEAAGAVDIALYEEMPDLPPGHLMGTARMGDDPATSVTDSYGRTHDVDNLWIADGSLFVTAGGVNPTNTIAALALRGATELVRQAVEKAEAS